METARRVGDLIWSHWRMGRTMAALPPELRPGTKAEAHAAQARLEQLSRAPRAGWKIAATSRAGQRHIGVDGPLAGRILVESLLEPGATTPLDGNRMRVAEPEFAFRLNAPLPARALPYEQAEVMAAVGSLHLSIELPDSRFHDFARVGGLSLIADDACARELVIGPEVSADWRGLDLAAHRVLATVGDRYDREGMGAAVLGDPRAALTWLANEVSELGLGLSAGEIVTTGTCCVPLDIVPGDVVRCDYGVLGKISVTLS